MEEHTKNISDYFIALRKRKSAIIIITSTIFLISSIIAFLLPPVYMSSATILIEQQGIPQDLVRSTVTSYAAERIQTINARVMSRTNLLRIIQKFDLYESKRKYETTEELVKRIRKDANLDVVSAGVIGPGGRATTATIAFSLSFEGESPSKVQKVANELTSLFLNENIKSRTQKAEETSSFLRQESIRLGGIISELEEKRSIFKEKNSKTMPGLASASTQVLNRVQSDISSIEASLEALADRKFYVKNQMSRLQPMTQGISARLKLLETRYASMKSRLSADHPDMQAVKREIELLKSEGTGADSSNEVATRLILLRVELKSNLEKYTEEHPSVIGLTGEISALENKLLELKNKPEDNYFNGHPDNPEYIELQEQLDAISFNEKMSNKKLARLRDKQLDYEDRISKIPQVEREYLVLVRDYQNAVNDYKSTLSKLSKAEVAKQLESESKGEKFTLIDPAAYPQKPISPNRPLILIFGIVLSLGCGIGYALVADAISGTIRGAKSIGHAVGLMPLSVIPYQMSMADIVTKKRIYKRVIFLIIAAIVVVILLYHFLVTPIDVLWFKMLRKSDAFMG